MSCEQNRARFFAQLASEAPIRQALGGDAAAATACLTTIYDTARQRRGTLPILADALTQALFDEMRKRGLTPPTHSARGLPQPTARQGYALVMQTLRAIRKGEPLPALAEEVLQARRTLEQRAAQAVWQSHAGGAPVSPGSGPPGEASEPMCAPDDPVGQVDPDLRLLLQQTVRTWSSKHSRLIWDVANATPPPPEHEQEVAFTLATVASLIQKHQRGRPSSVPLVVWARAFRNTPALRHALAVALLTTLEAPRCPRCGQWVTRVLSYHTCPSRAFAPDGYNGFGVDRYGVTRWDTRPNGVPVPRRRTLLDASQDFLTPTDPITTAAMADLWGRIASAIAGHECRIVLRPGGFETDMHGTICADPAPLGPDADPRHNLIVTKAGIYHEIGHELLTPPEDWGFVLAVANGTETVAGISRGRRMLTEIYNTIEDARMETELSRRFAGVAQTLAIACRLEPRWDELVGPDVPVMHQVMGALLYTGLPYFRVRDEVRAAMSAPARRLFEELEPIALGGARGGPADSLAASLEICRRLEAAGFVAAPKTRASPPPPPRPGTRPRSGLDEGQPTRREAAQEPGKQPPPAPPGAGGEDQERQGGERTEAAELSAEEVEQALNALEDQAIAATEREIARQGRYDVLGRVLHAPLRVGNEEPVGWEYQSGAKETQRYRTPEGQVRTIGTGAPLTRDRLLRRSEAKVRTEQAETAGRLARRLDSIRQESVRRLRLQTEGALDRRRLPAALAGRAEVRTRLSVEQETGMAVSLLLDQSLSMSKHITEGRLYGATSVVTQALEQLEIPYEVRGHGGLSLQYKAMDEPTLAAERAARLLVDNSGSNQITAPVVGLATTALLARSDQNRLIVNLMDGQMGDHEATVAYYTTARKAGVVTFGVFLGTPDAEQTQKMGELFGRKNWRAIDDLVELPKVVGQRIADIFEALGGA